MKSYDFEKYISSKYKFPDIYQQIEISISYADCISNLRIYLDLKESEIENWNAYMEANNGQLKGLEFEASYLVFLHIYSSPNLWIFQFSYIEKFIEVFKKSKYIEDLIGHLFSKASTLEEVDREELFGKFKTILSPIIDEIKVPKKPTVLNKIKWNGTHQELCVYWGYAGNCELIEMEQTNGSKIVNWDLLAEHFVVYNKKTDSYDELPSDYKSKYSDVMKKIEETKETELKKPRAIIELLTQIKMNNYDT